MDGDLGLLTVLVLIWSTSWVMAVLVPGLPYVNLVVVFLPAGRWKCCIFWLDLYLSYGSTCRLMVEYGSETGEWALRADPGE